MATGIPIIDVVAKGFDPVEREKRRVEREAQAEARAKAEAEGWSHRIANRAVLLHRAVQEVIESEGVTPEEATKLVEMSVTYELAEAIEEVSIEVYNQTSSDY